MPSAASNKLTEPYFGTRTIFEVLDALLRFQDYLRNIELETDTGCTLFRYFKFLSQKSTGELMTNAKFLRQFVLNHPKYQKDSVVSEEINFDMFCEIDKILDGQDPFEFLKSK